MIRVRKDICSIEVTEFDPIVERMMRVRVHWIGLIPVLEEYPGRLSLKFLKLIDGLI